MEIWSHNLQTVVAPWAVGRLDNGIIERWQILKKSKSSQAVQYRLF